ncbi:MAG TPA: SCO family protein [Stellaceae bacterium]|jgi:protein SCO1/2|nr:SCO family protein [Stellaceae bacterium]
MRRLPAAILLAMGLAGPAVAAPSSIPSDAFATFAFAQHPGALLPLDVTLRDGAGNPVRLGSLFDGQPVILDFEYDRCTTLCGVMLDQLTGALRSLPLRAGSNYRLVAIDIDPTATPPDAAAFAAAHGIAGRGMTVLTGDAASVGRIADTVGFPYRRDDATGQYAHPAGFVVATPRGTISRYLLGFDWRPLDLRLALSEAAAARIAAPAEAVLLFCYCYDPQTGRYDLAIGRLLEIVGAATLLSLGILIRASVRRAA